MSYVGQQPQFRKPLPDDEAAVAARAEQILSQVQGAKAHFDAQIADLHGKTGTGHAEREQLKKDYLSLEADVDNLFAAADTMLAAMRDFETVVKAFRERGPS